MTAPIERFDQLGLAAPILQALQDVGYETPSPIQAACIPALLDGRDILGMAQTGTGKTAAFALPLLEKIELARAVPQALVLTPTRELAIQVAEAFQKYAKHLPGFHVLPIYGGQSLGVQLRQLQRGTHVIVGTPGRVMDHLERKSLNLDGLKTLVLDEADEMLRMGFIDDVEWILEHTPATRQTALFSATMPEPIRRVAQKYLREPQEVKIKAATATVASIRQRFWQVSGLHKLDALTRILEVEDTLDAAIIFVRTKTATVELADKLEARGYAAAALNGDMNQALRERVIDQLKSGALDIVIATDVAARGIDVPRISHVINYDIPYDTEAYVHRIGRTGRAGRAGNAILFVSPRETRMLRTIERVTRQPIEPLVLPTKQQVADRRVATFKQVVLDTLAAGELDFFTDVVNQLEAEQNVGIHEIAAALAMLAQKEKPLQLEEKEFAKPREWVERDPRDAREGREGWDNREGRGPREGRSPREMSERFGGPREERGGFGQARSAYGESGGERPRFERAERSERPERAPREDWREREARPAVRREAAGSEGDGEGFARREPRDAEARAPRREAGAGDASMERYRVAVGRQHGATPKDIVGAIANEAGIQSRFIGRIDLFEDFSTVELPKGMPREVEQVLRRVRVRGVPMDLMRDDGATPEAPRRPRPAGDDAGSQTPFRKRREGGEGGERGEAPRGFGGDRPSRPPFRDGDRPARPGFARDAGGPGGKGGPGGYGGSGGRSFGGERGDRGSFGGSEDRPRRPFAGGKKPR